MNRFALWQRAWTRRGWTRWPWVRPTLPRRAFARRAKAGFAWFVASLVLVMLLMSQTGQPAWTGQTADRAVAQAAASEPCLESDQTVAQARLRVVRPSEGICWVIVSPNFPKYLIYRSFLFTGDGFLMVFNSYGGGHESVDTGAREFYFLPRRQMIGGFIVGNRLRVEMANGVVLGYDVDRLLFIEAAGAVVAEDPEITLGNQGGFELRPASGLTLDFGFEQGSSPTGNKAGKLKVIDAQGRTCGLRNADVLAWDSDGDASLKFATDEAAFRFIKGRCPSLSF